MASALIKFANKAARGSAAWAWKNSGATDVPLIRDSASWVGKNLRRTKAAGKPRKTQEDVTPVPEKSTPEEKGMLDQPIPGDRPKLTPVPGTKTGMFKREAANEGDAFVNSNREANERALKASNFQKTVPSGATGEAVPPQMVEDIHEIRSLLENQSQNNGGGDIIGGALNGLFGAMSGGLKLGKLGGIFKGLGQKIPGVLRGVGGLGAAASAGAILPKILSIPKGIAGTFGNVKTMGAGALDAAKTQLGAASTVGKGLMQKGAGLIKGLSGKAAAKSILKKVPGIGLLAGLGFGVSRAASGDFTGAGLEVASGLASTVPGIGTAASLGLDAALGARDASAESSSMNGDAAKIDAIPKDALKPAALTKAYMAPEGDAVPRGLANLQDFVGAAMDEDRGIFVRVVKDVFSSQSSATDQKQPQTPGEKAREAKRPAALTPSKPDVPAFQKVPRGGTTDLANSPIGDLIARGEGDYDSYNSGTKGVDGGKVGHSGKKNLAEMSLNEIIKSSETKDGNDKDRVFAAGRYQVITPTLKQSMKEMGLTGEEKFTPELQDKIFQETLLPEKAKNFINGKSNDVKGAQVALAKEWRSFADPRTGKTYADSGVKANKASITAAESESALLATRSKFELSNPEVQSLAAIDEATAAVKATEKQQSAAPVVIPVSTGGAAPSGGSGGSAGFGGHMGTRNGDSTIRRLTDAKMSYGLS